MIARGVMISCLVALLLLLSTAPTPGEEPTPTVDGLYRRDCTDGASAVGVIRGRAITGKRDTVLFVFDRPTFDPPPGRNVFRDAHDYGGDLDDWLGRLERPEALGAARVFAATTTCARPVEVGSRDWRARFRFPPEKSPWKRLDPLGPALRWMKRLSSSLPGRRRAIVLVTGEFLPEDLAPGTRFANLSQQLWRRRLLPFGTYWNEERIGGYLEKRGITLDVIAPEARFGDFLPLTDIPELPWAARPSVSFFGNPLLRAVTLPDLPFGDDQIAGRFEAITPMWFPTVGEYTPFNTDCPSTFGLWPLARAAARTGGTYVFYPFPPAQFLDLCPVDTALRRDLAPEMGTARDFVIARTGDAALVPLYDRAIGILVEASRRIRTGEVPRPHRRSRANLRLARFWFEMSAFHLEACSLYLTELEKYVPDDIRLSETREILITYVPAIWLSDCVLGYEKRVLPPEMERQLQAERDLFRGVLPAGEMPKGLQDNILPHARTSPWYRSLRQPREVLENLDPRLKPRAVRMIAAAQSVMDHEGRSPWGWMTYYSVAYTFVWKPSEPPPSGGRFGRPPVDDDEGDTTPRERPRPRPGSGGSPTGR